MEKSVLDILKGARRILSRPGAWTRKAYARDNSGQVVCSYQPEATQFCLVGACFKSARDNALPHAVTVALFPLVPLGTPTIQAFNDYQAETVEDVLTLLDWAIGIEEAGGF